MSEDPDTLREVRTRLDGLRLLYRVSTVEPPPGSPTLIHLHGFAISGRYLMPTASRLAPFYRTYVPDLPGFGRSQHPKKPLGIPELADAVDRFMDHIGLERAVLLGNSLGCPIIGDVIDRHPERIERVIFCSPAGGKHNLPIYRGAAQMALAGIREPLGMLPIALTDYLRYGIIPSIDLFGSMLHYPTVQRIFELRLPLLLVYGTRDPLVSAERVAHYAPLLPHMTAVALEGAAHAMNFSHPDQLANIVHSWLEGRPIVADPTAKGGVRVVRSERAG
jgi:pimeloyl-ACP methyl ester carboxylesterase